MRTKLRKVVEVYKNRGFFAVLSAIGHHVGWLLPPDEHRYVGLVITPIVGMLQGEIIPKRFDGSYVNIRIFGTHPTGGRMYHSPKWSYAQRKARISRYERRYFGHPDVPLSAGDVCLEVGAYIGMSTGVAADLCDQVIAVEPSPRNFRYLERNIRRSDVSIHNVGIWEETGEIDLQMGSDTTDDGFLPPDSGLDHSLKIQAYRIDDFISSVRGGEIWR
jgi:FkbM family methyltransferase